MSHASLQLAQRLPRLKPDHGLTCEACGAFRAEVGAPPSSALPAGAALCVLCAHHVIGHGSMMKDAAGAECECLPSKIYPTWYADSLSRGKAVDGGQPLHPMMRFALRVTTG